MKLLHLKIKGDVIAFSDPAVFDLARYAVTFPENVYGRVGGGFTIFNHRNGDVKDVTQLEIGRYRIGWFPSRDAGSLFRVCKIIKGG